MSLQRDSVGRAVVPTLVVSIVLGSAFLVGFLTNRPEEAVSRSPTFAVPSRIDLGCAGGLTMVISIGPYQPVKKGSAKTPLGALQRFMRREYPNAAILKKPFRLSGRDTVNNLTRFRRTSDDGRVVSVAVTAQTAGQHYVEEFSVCEGVAKAWVRR